MKKAITFLVSVMIFISSLSLFVFADDKVNGSYIELSDGVVFYTCSYSVDEKKIDIHGNVNYDALVAYSNYKIEIYKIPPNQSFKESFSANTCQQMASMSIAVKFAISFEITETADKFCQYAVVFRSPKGEAILAATPRRVSLKADYKYSQNDSSGFKGIYSSSTQYLSNYGDIGFGTAIIPVYYDKLLNPSSNGYMYAHEGEHIYFDSAYIDSLSARIRTYSAGGTRVYLQLLLSSGTDVINGSGGDGTNEKYDMPDVYNSDTASLLSTFIRYLTSTYSEYSNGIISGFVIGKKIDTVENNYNGELAIEDYARKYSYYLAIAANSSRIENPNIDIVVPFSSFNAYTDRTLAPKTGYSPSKLLSSIASSLDLGSFSKFNYSVMIESDTSPIVKTVNAENSEQLYTVEEKNAEYLSVNALADYNSFLNELSKKYMSVPDNYIFMWTVPSELYGNALSIAYAYSYYSLLHNSKVSAFAVSFDGGNASAFTDIKKLLETIDTKNGENESNALLKYLGIASWSDIIEKFSYENVFKRHIYVSENQKLSSKEWKGSFSYFDFKSSNTSLWTGTSFSKNLKSDYGSNGQRALCQVIQKPVGISHSDLLYMYEYDENFSHTPALRFRLEISDSENNGGLYEISVTVGKNENTVSETYVVRAGEVNDLWLDIKDFGTHNKANHIKISTRSITGEAEEYKLWLYDISGSSDKYSSEELASMISSERFSVRDDDINDGVGEVSDLLYTVVFVIVLSAVLLAGAMFVIFRREDSGRKKRIKNGIVNIDKEKDK